jgi:hypothetical protein
MFRDIFFTVTVHRASTVKIGQRGNLNSFDSLADEISNFKISGENPTAMVV